MYRDGATIISAMILMSMTACFSVISMESPNTVKPKTQSWIIAGATAVDDNRNSQIFASLKNEVRSPTAFRHRCAN